MEDGPESVLVVKSSFLFRCDLTAFNAVAVTLYSNLDWM